MNLPDFSDWPAITTYTDDDDNDDDDSIEMTASVASVVSAAASGGEEEESWHDDEHEVEISRTTRRRRRRRQRSDTHRRCGCCPPCNLNCSLNLQPGSSPGAVANLCSATLGAGVLSLPCAIKRCGVLPGLVLLALAAAATVVSIDMIVDAAARTGRTTYEDITRRLLGRRALVIVEAAIFAFCFGCAVAYVVAVGDILQRGILDVFVPTGRLPSFVTREFAMVVFWLIVMLPLSLLERIDHLRFASVVGVGSVAFLVVASVVHSVRDLANASDGDGIGSDEYYSTTTMTMNGGYYSHTRAGQDVRWWTPASVGDAVLACPIIMFAFSCQVNVCAIYEELGDSTGRSSAGEANGGGPSAAADFSSAADLTRTRRRGNISGPPSHQNNDEDDSHRRKAAQMARVTRAAVGICVLLYSLIGIFAYLDFGDATADNVLKNYHVRETRDPLMIATFAFTTVAVVLAFPLNVFPARVTLDGVARRMLAGNQGGDDGIGDNIGSSERIESEDSGAALERPLLEEDRIGEQISPTSASSIPDVERPSSPSSRSRHVVLTLIISGGALLAALVVPDISVVFGIMGGTASSVICFIFPGLFVLKMKQFGGNGHDDDVPPHPPPTFWRSVQAWILILGGSLIGILSTCITLYNMFV